MPTLQATKSPSSRRESGDHVIAAAKTVDTTLIKAKLAAFTKTHGAYVTADNAVRKAEAALQAAEEKVGEADAGQDAAVIKLAAKLIGDGAPKGNPLKLFGHVAPSRLIEIAVPEEAKLTAKLATDAARWKDAGKETKAAANDLGKASALVKKALEPVAALRRAHSGALAQRDAHGVAWARAFAHLKVSARAAEIDGATGIFSALFGVAAKPKAHKKPVKLPATAPTP